MPRGTANAAVRMTSQKEPVTKLIRKTRQATRRRYSPDEKIRIVIREARCQRCTRRSKMGFDTDWKPSQNPVVAVRGSTNTG